MVVKILPSSYKTKRPYQALLLINIVLFSFLYSLIGVAYYHFLTRNLEATFGKTNLIEKLELIFFHLEDEKRKMFMRQFKWGVFLLKNNKGLQEVN